MMSIDEIKNEFEGRKTDVVRLVDTLFQTCAKHGAVAGRQQDIASVILEFGDGTTAVFPVEQAQGKFRMVCARLCAISNDLNPELNNIYIGVCTMPYRQGVIKVECENTLKSHYFKLQYKKGEQ